jgi:hypothetical protein
MPCTTTYAGNASSTKTYFKTKLDVDLTMHDEFGTILGFIKNEGDYILVAQLLDKDGENILEEKKFYLIEQNTATDEAYAKKNGLEKVYGTVDDLVQEARDWLTMSYRYEVHSKDFTQDLFEAGGLSNYIV